MLLELKNISVAYFGSFLFKRKPFFALKNISFSVNYRESVTILGESGSGKTTLGRLTVRLVKPTEGKVFLKGRNIFSYGKEYTRKVSMVFQNPREALNPRYSVWGAVEEPLLVHGIKNRKEIVEKVLTSVDIEEKLWFRKTYQLSGGQKQRVAIARALALNPLLIVADEPTSALDLSMAYEILELFKKLKHKQSLIFITHDVRMGTKVGEKIILLLGGRILEISPVKEFLEKPLHPYGVFLLNNLPVESPYKRKGNLKGMELETLRDEGCPFRINCPYNHEKCKLFPPERIVKVENGERRVWCWIYI